MTENEKKIFEGLVQKTLNLTETETLASLYNEAGELINIQPLLDIDASRVAKFKNDSKQQRDRGFKESREAFEKELMEEYSITSDLQGIELVKHILDTQTTDLKTKLETKTKDVDIEKNPAFIQKRIEWEKQVQVKEKEWEKKFETREAEWQKDKIFDQVSKKALLCVDTDFIQPDNPDRTAALKEVLINTLKGENYQITEDGTIHILDKDGKLKEDAHGRAINFKDYTEQIASKYFDKKQADKRGNSGNQTQTQTSNQIKIKDQSDFQAQMAIAKDATERAAILKAAKEAGISK
jgi:hypothetical protein